MLSSRREYTEKLGNNYLKRHVTGNCHARFGTEEKAEKISKPYLSLLFRGKPVIAFIDTKIKFHIDGIDHMQASLKGLEAQIKTMIGSKEFPAKARRNIELLDEIPGIGFLTAATLIAEIGDFSLFNSPKALPAIYDHAAILKYGSDGSNMVIETVGNGPVTYDNWTTFLGGHNYLGAFYNPSYQPASSILATAASLEAVPGLQYSWQGQMYVDSTAGSLITLEHITTLRCDGLVEYCYEYNNSRIWGCASAADSNWDISLKSNVSVHQSLGTNGYYYISPNVQCSQTSYTKLIKR